jgi:hypothetical protein
MLQNSNLDNDWGSSGGEGTRILKILYSGAMPVRENKCVYGTPPTLQGCNFTNTWQAKFNIALGTSKGKERINL